VPHSVLRNHLAKIALVSSGGLFQPDVAR